MKVPGKRLSARIGCALSLACLLAVGFNSVVVADSAKFAVKVMTRNMDAGTDLNFVTAAQSGPEFIVGVYQTVAEVDARGIPARAALLAKEIADQRPDLIALQEVTVWEITDANGSRLYDQLGLLQAALAAKNLHYRVVAVQQLTYIPVDLNPFGFPLAVKFTDQNAVLIRTDIPPGHLDALGAETHVYQSLLPFELPTGDLVDVLQGWMVVEIKVRGARFRFANTHLLSPVPLPDLFPITAYIQSLQAKELIAALSDSESAVILAGDFNSDATMPQHGPDKTSSAGDISSAGYLDAWQFLQPTHTGYTWPLFLEDQLSGTDPTRYTERIDILFSRGLKPLSVKQTGLERGQGDLYASDHSGVVATFDLDGH